MVQFKVLSGKMAGNDKVARHFPFQIGRSSSADLQLEEDGVWDQHLVLNFDVAEGFILSTQPNAIAAVNGHQFERAVLRNGDTIEIGALKLRFWLTDTRQTSLWWREWLTWIGIASVAAFELWLIYWLTD